MFVDASAIVATLTREAEAGALLESAPSPITSPIAIFEAVLGVCRKRHASIALKSFSGWPAFAQCR